METDKFLGRKPAKRINAQIKVLDGESKRLILKKNDIDAQLSKLKDEKLWVDWYADYLKDVDDRQTLEGEERLQLIQKYVEKIDVYLDKDELRHTLEIKFNLPIVDDRLKWNNSTSKRDGYTLHNGRDIKEIFLKKNVGVDGMGVVNRQV